MPVPRIQGALKRKIATDLAVGFTIGSIGGGYWWWGYHLPKVARREAYYAELKAKKDLEDN